MVKPMAASRRGVNGCGFSQFERKAHSVSIANWNLLPIKSIAAAGQRKTLHATVGSIADSAGAAPSCAEFPLFLMRSLYDPRERRLI